MKTLVRIKVVEEIGGEIKDLMVQKIISIPLKKIFNVRDNSFQIDFSEFSEALEGIEDIHVIEALSKVKEDCENLLRIASGRVLLTFSAEPVNDKQVLSVIHISNDKCVVTYTKVASISPSELKIFDFYKRKFLDFTKFEKLYSFVLASELTELPKFLEEIYDIIDELEKSLKFNKYSDLTISFVVVDENSSQ